MSSLSVPSLQRRTRSTSFNHHKVTDSSIPILLRKGSFPVTSTTPKATPQQQQQQQEEIEKEEEVEVEEEKEEEEEEVYPPRKQRQSNKRDIYGFLIESQWVDIDKFQAFQDYYQPILVRRSIKWKQLLDEHQGQFPPRSNKVKRYIRKGIPRELRGQAWFHYSGANKNMKPGVYQEYLNKALALGHQNEFLDIIERDLHRTFPENAKFKDEEDEDEDEDEDEEDEKQHHRTSIVQSLFHVLLAFSIYHPSIGYCQSLNYIVGMMLLQMEEDEERVFWLLVTLVNDILPKNVYDVTMEGANIDQNVLWNLVSERYPALWSRLAENNMPFWKCEQSGSMPTCSLVTSHWFLTLFINILPIETVLRVWDCLFYDGQKVLFRVALAIIKLSENELLGVKDSIDIFQKLQSAPKGMIDCHQLIEATYSQYASTTSLTDEEIIDLRDLFKQRRDERRRNIPVQPYQRKMFRMGSVRRTFTHKAKEAKWYIERAKTVRR